jgi:hypothetical protein
LDFTSKRHCTAINLVPRESEREREERRERERKGERERWERVAYDGK